MAFLLTFLGKGGTGRTTVAIAAAKQFAEQGYRVLLASQNPGPGFDLMMGAPIGTEPQELGVNLKAVQLRSTVLLEKAWEDLKKLEAEYVRTPFFKTVFGQELGILPGMDSALALNALREYEGSGSYDVIIYDGPGDLSTLRMVGTPEILSWYARRFRQVIADSDLGKALSPFVQPVTAAVFTVNLAGDNFAEPTERANAVLDDAKRAISDPNRVAAYLVTTGDEVAIATAQYYWGSAQQVGLSVGGVIANPARTPLNPSALQTAFDPLSVVTLPEHTGDWQPLIAALPDLKQAAKAPKPIEIDIIQGQVKLFLPKFEKSQVKLTQYGPEVTIEAGDQRRNIFLPSELRGKPVKAAKFQGGYLTITF
ncbi:ArsA family ATPase [Acaryochloris sp. CCMEE 5410]|uniref:Get3/ArsA fold putative tail anchor-mediating ATPase NosAFP n=1 Tax=Acaryochloris sp. CCMEE 5410 TaxID=310037 RepID=UPI00024845B2|nr:ArsA family ATPase [Acaryochloris sp. CCMEE 5410]KAI9132157.1 ArsA family ATPase [Acaryochloris sp. CCMEE 5410]